MRAAGFRVWSQRAPTSAVRHSPTCCLLQMADCRWWPGRPLLSIGPCGQKLHPVWCLLLSVAHNTVVFITTFFNEVIRCAYAAPSMCGRSVPPTHLRKKGAGGREKPQRTVDLSSRPINGQRTLSCRPLVCLCSARAAIHVNL